MHVGACHSLGMAGCAGDASWCVWHLGEGGMGADFAGQKLSPSPNSQQGQQSPQLPTVGSGAGGSPARASRVPAPTGAPRCAPPHSNWQAKPATGLPGRFERILKKRKRTDRNRVSRAKGQVKQDIIRANVVLSPKVHKLIYVAAVN